MSISGQTLIARIENWARAQRSGRSAGQATSVEGQYRNSYHADRDDTGAISQVDVADAAIVNEAWKRCAPTARELLRWHYVYRASQGFVCRRFNIPHRPAHHFELAMWRARGELAEQLEHIEGIVNDKNTAYTSAIRLQIPAFG